MASKSAYRDSEPGAEIEELLDTIETSVDRLKVMYEQYFLGILKLAPGVLHSEVERKLRDLAQIQIRNTALRYRLATIQQKYGSYNTYWRRTMRQIEQGTYVRSLSRVSRKAVATGGDIPDEILAAMPKRMRDQVARDRAAALANAGRRGQIDAAAAAQQLQQQRPPARAAVDADERDIDFDDDVAEIVSPPPGGGGITHRVDTAEMDQDDLEKMLAELAAADLITPTKKAAPAPKPTKPAPAPARPAPPPKPPAIAIPKAAAAAIQAAALPNLRSTQPIPKPGLARDPDPDAFATEEATFSKEEATMPRPGAPPMPAAPPPTARPTTPPPVPARAAAARPGGPGHVRARTPPVGVPMARPQAPPAPPLPPGMSEADVRTLYAKYARARELVGERNDESTYQTLLRTLHQQAPKIMAQYNAKSVEFGVVIKDKQVVLKAKPKT